MTNNDERDTKFLGFANLLMYDLGIDMDDEGRRQLIARRAYDLACHVRENDYAYMELVPDLTEWPPTE